MFMDTCTSLANKMLNAFSYPGHQSGLKRDHFIGSHLVVTEIFPDIDLVSPYGIITFSK